MHSPSNLLGESIRQISKISSLTNGKVRRSRKRRKPTTPSSTMLLRCQCRALLSRPPLNRASHIRHYPAYRGDVVHPLYARPPPPSKRRRHSEPDAEPEELDQEEKPDPKSRKREKLTKEQERVLRALQESSRDEVERPLRKPKRGLESIDPLLTNKDLGLYSGPRKRKRDFIRWMVTSGSKHEFFPQEIAMDIESRRVERMRKNAEERMFKQLNDFFNSLSEEEIENKSLITPLKAAGEKNSRPIYPHPSPLERILECDRPTSNNAKEIESNVLHLLKRHNKYLWSQYQDYIDWSDYKLQKQTLYFRFPADLESPEFQAVVLRLLAIEEEGLKKSRYRKEEKTPGEGGHRESPKPELDGNKDPNSDQLDELIKLNRMETEQTRQAEDENDGPELSVETSDSEGTSSKGNDETTSENEIKDVNTQKISELDSSKTLKEDPNDVDLAYYLGPALPPYTRFPTLPIYKHHYVNPTQNPTPFLMNPTFKPWRPIPHATRLKMFDAWRAGLGLRNIAWLGGVSWRRVDGIIGILKKEWEFVEKVISLSSQQCVL